MLKTEAENDVKQQDQETQNEQVGVWHNPIESHDNGMTIEDLVEGNTNAEVASQGNQVCVRYHGELMNGDIVDPTDGEDDTYTFRLGAGEVIRGWDIGILGYRLYS
ncbi:peptidyl-prolyl cis-trans isomerase FKBP15-3-like [Oryza brachyantha]|uniref:peptidyl-prolyl cis-trans isomerase FKBP15-3-like n=1 Tax=Oryza brachyantha TaxID=4533 RepID=UPI001AD9797C|nr:peptidyl-prolyl cis-trans isomerase FKBP15-3-like [Oryza brachyantha]